MIGLGLFVMPFATAMQNCNPNNSDNYIKAQNIWECMAAAINGKGTSSFSQKEKQDAVEGLLAAEALIDQMIHTENDINDNEMGQNN